MQNLDALETRLWDALAEDRRHAPALGPTFSQALKFLRPRLQLLRTIAGACASRFGAQRVRLPLKVRRRAEDALRRAR